MNRKYIAFFLLSFVTVAALFFSCRKDHSTLDLDKLPGVVIDTAGSGAYSVLQFEHLVVTPNLVTSIPESELSYHWRINLAPGDTVYQEIGTSRNLDYEMGFKPNAAGKFHQLVYTVTDNNTGLKYIMAWPVTVKNNIGEGLVIAETSDNINTDISHIMSPEVTTGYNSISVKHHVYSTINGSTIPGLVKQMRFTTIYGVDGLFAITNDAIVRINTLDYTYGGMNDDLFYASTADYKPQALGGIYQGDMYVGNRKLTGTYLGASRKFGLPFDYKYDVPDHVAFNAGGYNPLPVRINFYDEVNGYFVYLPTIASFGDNKMHEYPSQAGPFDPSGVPNKLNLAAGISVEKDFLHLLKDKTTGKIELYVLDQGGDAYPSPVPPAPKALYDLTGAPGISNATKFVFLDDQKVMYYATDNKIYAMLYSTPTPVFEERYTAPAGETITTLQVYQQVGYPTTSGPFIPTNNKQLIMSTYGTEGRVYLMPIINVGLGNIDNANIKNFGGFGKITAIATQK